MDMEFFCYLYCASGRVAHYARERGRAGEKRRKRRRNN